MNSNHAQRTLFHVIKRSVSALKLAVEDMRLEPTKLGIARVVEECETVSAAVAQLARHVDLSKIDPPKPREDGPNFGPALIRFAELMDLATANGFCPTCGGVCARRQPVQGD